MRFTTKCRDDFFLVEIREHYGFSPLESQNNFKDQSISKLLNVYEELLGLVIQCKQTVCCIAFGTVGNFSGALYALLEPILNHHQEVCGVKVSSTAYTSLAFGCHNWPLTNQEQNKHNVHILNKLTPRQKDILYLLALDFSLQEIADLFKLSRGTVSKTLMQIALKFDFESYTVKFILEKIGIGVILSNLTIPDIAMPFRMIYFIHKEFLQYDGIHFCSL